MLGVDAGSTEIDGVDEGLIDGTTLAVGTALGFSLGDTESVGTILGLMDGPIDSDGNSLGSVVGVRLPLGPMLGTEKGPTDTDGDEEDEGLIDSPILVVGVCDGVLDGSILVVGTSLGFFVAECGAVGNILDFKDGAMDLDGNLLVSVVGLELSLGPMLDAEVGDPDQVARKKYYFQSRIVRTSSRTKTDEIVKYLFFFVTPCL
jgi:hypothetical protein